MRLYGRVSRQEAADVASPGRYWVGPVLHGRWPVAAGEIGGVRANLANAANDPCTTARPSRRGASRSA